MNNSLLRIWRHVSSVHIFPQPLSLMTAWPTETQRGRHDHRGRPLMCLSDTADRAPHSFFPDWMCSRTRHRSGVNQKESHSCQSPLLQQSRGKYTRNPACKHTQTHRENQTDDKDWHVWFMCVRVFFSPRRQIHQSERLSLGFKGADVRVCDLCCVINNMIRSWEQKQRGFAEFPTA